MRTRPPSSNGSTRATFLVWSSSLVFMLFAVGAGADDLDSVEAEAREIKGAAELLRKQYLGAGGFKSKHYAEERLIDGENYYRLKDYQRAAIILMDVIESYPDHAAYPDALFYFADSLFQSRDFHGARQWFKRLLDEAGRPGVGRFREKALERLIEISIHIDDFEGVDGYFQQLGQSPGAAARYIKGKYLYFMKDYDAAAREFASVKGDVQLELKATYFIGVLLTRQGRYDDAIATFKAGAAVKVATNAEQEIIDLMNLGLGRLYYEKDFVENATAAYESVGRYSPYYDTALYEAASVQIRAGNAIAAERILEVLTLAMPDSKYIPKAKLLRGHLLLRAGRYDEAEKVFEETIGEFTPVRDQLDALMKDQQDTAAFFASLMERSQAALDVSGVLPPLIVKWVSEEREVQRALELTSDLGIAREHARETERLLRLLEAVIEGPSRINAIPTLRDAKRRGQQMSNRIGQLRGMVSASAGAILGSQEETAGEIAKERRALEERLVALPTSEDAYKRREDEARAVFKRMSQELARNVIRLDSLVAMIVALERFSENPVYTEGASAQSIEALRDELTRHRAGVDEKRAEVEVLKEEVDRAGYQIGVGDVMDAQDLETRDRAKALAERERAAVRAKGTERGRRLERVHAAIDEADAVLAAFHEAIDREAQRQIEDITRQIETEHEHVRRYTEELASLSTEAEDVVGGVTRSNFSNVRRRFHELVLKADVGIIDVAWMRKEEHKARGSALNKDRLADIQNLDDEFAEVKESSGAAPAAGAE